MANVTRESHYVPQATLRRWSDDGTNIYAYRRLVSHANVPEWELKSVRGLAQQRDLYTTFEGGVEGDAFERFIAREVEEPGQEAIEKLVNNRKMKPQDWSRVATFAAAQQMRTPLFLLEWVRRFNAHVGESLPAILDEVRSMTREQLIEAEHQTKPHSYLDDALRVDLQPAPDAPGFAVATAQVRSTRTAWLRFVQHTLRERTQYFVGHRWRVMKLARGCEWPLTDNPLIALNWYGPGRFDFNAGWGKPGSEFILPVSPVHAVCARVGATDREPFFADEQVTSELQRIAVTRSLRWVFARRPMPWVASCVPRFVDKQAYETEQHTLKTWHDEQLGQEAEFRALPKPPGPP